MSNFTDVMEQNCYYVDKTMYLPLLEDQAHYLIFTRPRRFGKSLFLDMIRSYYDLSRKNDFRRGLASGPWFYRIARAILKDTPIIILDEATSSVDPENEAELQQAIEKLTEDKTVIIIAHRLKTVRNAQQIVVIANGRIAQRGTHQELMTQPGIYADFVNIREKAVNWKISSSKIQQ